MPCVPLTEPLAALTTSSTDTPEAFAVFNKLYAAARTAPVPLGYDLAAEALNASVRGKAYQGFTLLSSYDPIVCADSCGAQHRCNAFNICTPHLQRLTMHELMAVALPRL